MRLIPLPTLIVAALLVLPACRPPESVTAETPPPQPGSGEAQTGWRPLFDGSSFAGWRAFGKSSFPTDRWYIEEGWLKLRPGGQGGDIISAERFTDFELEWEWVLANKANNGLKYMILEERGEPIGHEYQMIDTVESPLHATASFYEVLAPAPDPVQKPAGEINRSRIVVRGNHVEHWLNDSKVLEYELGSERVRQGVAASKFKDVPGFGNKVTGHIVLTDHHDETWYRNIRIRELPIHGSR